MKLYLSLIATLFAFNASAITVSSPNLSPMLNEYDSAKVTDENGNVFPMIAVFQPDSTGRSGISTGKLVPGLVSQVTGRRGPPLFKAAGGKYIPMYALAQVNLSSSTASVFTAKIDSLLCNASLGGSATETLTCTGLLPTDSIMAISQKTPGSLGTAVTRYGTPASDSLLVGWTGNPGAGSIINALIRHQ